MKKILITSGGTREMIDGVRCLTNISSGKLGSMILDECLCEDDKLDTNFSEKNEFHFVMVKGSVLPSSPLVLFYNGIGKLVIHEVTDVESVMLIMEELVPQMDVVIHPMAVSDFGFIPLHTKLKSNDPEAFIQSLKDRIYQTPKILSHIKKWNPKCFLISFKFEDGLEHDELIKVATDSMIRNQSDVVVANDKAEIKKNKNHTAYFIYNNKIEKIKDKKGIAKKITNIIYG